MSFNKSKLYMACFLAFLFYSVFSPNANAAGEINVSNFGAYVNDKIEDTESIQKAINNQSSKGGGTVYFPKGEYLIDAVQSIVLKDNITLKFEKGAVLKALPNSAENYQIIRIHDVENINIVGPLKILGERDKHLGTLGEWGMGISIRGASNVLIENASISNAWGDAIYIGHSSKQNYSKNIKIHNPILENNRRQGISVVSVKGLEISNAIITNTNGASPQCGIDIEPSKPTQYLEDIKITNLTTANNEGAGVKLYLKYYQDSKNPVSILVDSIAKISDGIVIKDQEGLKGEIKIAGYQYLIGSKAYTAPTIEPVTNFSTNITGSAPKDTLVTISTGDTVLGKSEITTSGKFDVKIPKQQAGTVIRVRISDLFSNYINAKYITVEADNYLDFNSKHWAYKEVMYLAQKDIINGYLDGTFRPNNNTTRAEAAKMLSLALNLPLVDTKSGYKDVGNNHWAKDYIAAASKAGLFNGYPDGTFLPNGVLTRAEMAKVISIAYKLDISKVSYFKDVKKTHWANGYISGLFENDITEGFPDATFRPNDATTRAEYSVFLARALNQDFR